MPPVYTGNLAPVIHHLDHLFCQSASSQILLPHSAPASAFLEHQKTPKSPAGRLRTTHLPDYTTSKRATSFANEP